MKRINLVAAMMAAIVAITPFALPMTARADTKRIELGLDVQTDGKAAFQPGERAEYKVTVTNNGIPTWIRVHYECSKQGIDADFSEENLEFADGWVKRGDYYYWTQSTRTGGAYPVVDGLNIPDMTASSKGASVTVSVYAEAVQASGFRPDFSKDEPWEGAEVEYRTSTDGFGGVSGGNGDGGKGPDETRPDVTPAPDGGNTGGNSQDAVFEIPETGDNRPVAVMLVLMAASICGMGMTLAALKKEEDES